MGRKPSVNLNLPKGMRARKRWNNTFYYLDTGGKPRKEIPLGNDFAMAVKKWAELQINAKPIHQEIVTFRYVAERYTKTVIPTKAPRTQKDNLSELKWLYKFFDNPPCAFRKNNARQYSPVPGLAWKYMRQAREGAFQPHLELG